MQFLDGIMVFCAFAALLIYRMWYRKRFEKFLGYSLPPGPRGLPLIGNLLDMPSEKEWLTFAEWGKKYGKPTVTFIKYLISLLLFLKGPICHVNVFGRQIFILNTYEAMVDLLERRSQNYSERPYSLMVYDMQVSFPL